MERLNMPPTTSPPQGVSYVGPITDTARWTNFRHRPDDIFVCTPPKCGTTWTQAICAMLIFGTPEHGQQPGVISPWVDANFAPIEEYLGMVEAQTHRRYLKTHTPFDGIPYFPECTYLAVFRDPRDVYFSQSNHRDNMNDREMALAVFQSGDNAFDDWLRETRVPGEWDRYSLDTILHCFRTYWDQRHLPNVHLFHYSDMKRDLRGAIAAMAAATGTRIDDAQLDAFTRAASFEHMQKNADQFVPVAGVGFWKEDRRFFATGKSEQWKGRLSPAQLAAFDARLAELVTPEQAHWLLNGSLSNG
jgi:aryl sulfotransferase